MIVAPTALPRLESLAEPRLALSTTGRETALPEIGLGKTGLHPLTSSELVDYVLDELDRGRGGWLQSLDLHSLALAERDEKYLELLENADVRAPAGPWLALACRLQRTPLPERVVIAELVQGLAAEAARSGRSLFLVTEHPDTCARVTQELARKNPGLRIAGCAADPRIEDPIELAGLMRRIEASAADLVLVGLGSTSEEELIQKLRRSSPHSWFLGVGASLRLVSGALEPMPRWMMRLGLQSVQRLFQEPARLGVGMLRSATLGMALLARSAVNGMLPKGKNLREYGGKNPRALLLDDDSFALDHLELLLQTRFPALQVEKRTSIDLTGSFDFYFIDNDFDGERMALQLARHIKEEDPDATVIAHTGVVDVDTLKHLINVGCDGICDKTEPSSWRPIFELIDARIRRMISQHDASRHAFGGVRGAAYSISRLLHEWNQRDTRASRGLVG